MAAILSRPQCVNIMDSTLRVATVDAINIIDSTLRVVTVDTINIIITLMPR